jgi:SAM-dependent methyltransferase
VKEIAVMSNPWLDVTEADYDGHMNSPAVDQTRVLAELLRDTLAAVRPREVLLLGCTTGNGLEHVDPDVTVHVSAVDIHGGFLARLVERFPSPRFDLRTRCADLATAEFDPDAYDLAHAALVLEYFDWRPAMPRLARALRSGGVFSTVIQRPSTSAAAVAPSPFPTIQKLAPLFHFVEPDDLIAEAGRAGLSPVFRQTVPLPSAKQFEVLRFAKRP